MQAGSWKNWKSLTKRRQKTLDEWGFMR